jgi:hypothetical protein
MPGCVTTVTFVTMFFRPTNGYRSIESYLTYFAELSATGLPFFVFTDDVSLIKPSPNLTVIQVPRPSGPTDVCLPPERSVQKDTADYLWIQLEKLHCLAQASAMATTPYLAWIDFGAYHMFKDTVLATLALRRIATRTYPTTTVFAPSCWPPGEYPIWDRICWRFCGTFLLGHRDQFPALYARQQSIVTSHLPKLTWEVNYWCLMEDLFTTYPADHNERLLTELCHYVCPEASGTLNLI